MSGPGGPRPGTVVLGLGNPVRGDDAVGLKVAEEVARRLAEKPVAGVEVVTSTRAGLELIDVLAGASRGIVVDALVLPDPSPGRVRRLSLDDVSGAPRLVGAHDVTIGAAFDVARASGVPMPDDLEIYAIEAAETETIVEDLSAEVALAVPAVADRIMASLLRR